MGLNDSESMLTVKYVHSYGAGWVRANAGR